VHKEGLQAYRTTNKISEDFVADKNKLKESKKTHFLMNSFHILIFALALRYSVVLLNTKLIKLQGECEREKSDIHIPKSCLLVMP
jgi:hypothetical protein